MSSIPSRSVCEVMLDTLRDGKYQAVSCSLGTYTNSSLDTLLNVHSLRDISQQVKQEKTWLTKTPPLPNHQCALPGFLDVYQKLLFDNAADKVVINTGILTSDLANLTSNRWLNIAMINGFIHLLNAHHHNTMTAVFMLNDLLMLNDVDLQRHARSVMRGKQIKAIVFIINVAGGNKKTDVATPNKPGCHWSLLYIDAVENKWFYCDTLAWPPPTNINTTVNAILNVSAKEFFVFRKPAQGRFIAHKPEGNQHGSHQCTNGCFKNVPLQSCGSVCGVIVVVMGAISSLYPTLWRAGFLDTRAPVSNEFLWLRNPTLHSCFLRRVLIHWICSKDIDLQLLGIQGTNQVSQHPTVPSSTGTAQKPLPVTGQKPTQVTDQKPPPMTGQKSLPVMEQKPPPVTVQKPLTGTKQKPPPVTDQKPPPVTERKPLTGTKQMPPPVTDQKPPTDINQKPKQVTDQKPPPMMGQKSLPVMDQKPPVRTDQIPRKATKSSREKNENKCLRQT